MEQLRRTPAAILFMQLLVALPFFATNGGTALRIGEVGNFVLDPSADSKSSPSVRSVASIFSAATGGRHIAASDSNPASDKATSSANEQQTLTPEAAADKISSLPGQPGPTSFAQYSGYVTVDAAKDRALFYYFVEAQEDASSKPLVLWLNGGPGCSSLGGGGFSELGPFFPKKGGSQLEVNKHSWNTAANVLFLESPANVGFSYSNASADNTVGDKRTATDSYSFLLGFLRRFPQYQSRPLYITGESYGGHYVPQLAALIVEKNQQSPEIEVKLEGFAVGNAWTDANIDNQGAAFFWWTHALISDAAFFGIQDNCDFSVVGPLRNKQQQQQQQQQGGAKEGGSKSREDLCDESVSRALHETGIDDGSISIYDIYSDVCLTSTFPHQARQLAKRLAGTPLAHFSTQPFASQVQRHEREVEEDAREGAGETGGTKKMKQQGKLGKVDPCIDDEVDAYLNRADVQEALHVRGPLPREWQVCSDTLDYSRDDLLSSVLPLYPRLLAAGLKVLIFSGDVDAIVPVTGTRAWLRVLQLPVEQPWRRWVVDGQVAGYYENYKGLSFATVREAGHMVPYTQPARGQHLFAAFLKPGPFNP